MRKMLLIIGLLLFSGYGWAQIGPVPVVRIANLVTAFGQAIPEGTEVIVLSDGTKWVATSGVLSTATMTTAAASFTPRIVQVTGVSPITASGTNGKISVGINAATITTPGTLSALDKVKLDQLSVYSVTFNSTGGGSPGISYNGTANKIVDYSTVGALAYRTFGTAAAADLGIGALDAAYGNHTHAGLETSGDLAAHIALTTTAHGLGASAFHTNSYYLLSTGTAVKATILETARLINGVAFDGSTNITVPITWPSGNTGDVLTYNGSSWSSAGSLTLNTTGTAANVTGVVPISNGGTGATYAALARTNLGLGNSAILNTGTTSSSVALGDHTHNYEVPLTFSTGLTRTGNTITADLSATMDYPAAGLALSTGTAWDTSVTNNSGNWNTSYSWGNWASNFGTIGGKIAEGNHTHTGVYEVPLTFSTGLSRIGNTITATGVDVNWNGNSSVLVAATGRTSLGLGGLATVNTTVQVLSGTSVAWNAVNGINATLTLSGNTTITLSNLQVGTSGNIRITNPATAYTITIAGYSCLISSSVYSATNVMVSSGASKKDVYSWYWDGTYLMWNGALDIK
jgi:hypothetical protein